MKFLLVNQSFYPDQSATSQYLTDLALALVEQGHETTVLSCSNAYLPVESTGEAMSNFTPDNYRGVNIIRVKSFQNSQTRPFVRIVSALAAHFFLLLRLITLPRSDVTIFLTSPPLIGWITTRFCKKPSLGFYYWVMDVNPDQAIEAGWIKKDSLLTKFLEKALISTLNRSRWIVALDRFMSERLQSKVLHHTNIHIKHLWPLNNIHSVPKSDCTCIDRFNLRDKFIVMYSGNLSLCHPLTTMLEAALCLKNDPAYHFIFVGGGARAQEVEIFKRDHALSNISYEKYQDRERLSDSLSSADIHVVSLGDQYSGIVHPSKIYSIVAVKRPFILLGPKNSFIYEQFVSHGVGYHVSHDDVQSFINALRQERAMSIVEKHAREKTMEDFTAALSSEKGISSMLSLVVDEAQRQGLALNQDAHKK